MSVIDIKRRRRIEASLHPERDVRLAIMATCQELGGDEGLRGYFKTLAKEHPDQFVKLLFAALGWHGR